MRESILRHVLRPAARTPGGMTNAYHARGRRDGGSARAYNRVVRHGPRAVVDARADGCAACHRRRPAWLTTRRKLRGSGPGPLPLLQGRDLVEDAEARALGDQCCTAPNAERGEHTARVIVDRIEAPPKLGRDLA